MITIWKKNAARPGIFFGKVEDTTGVDVGSRFMKSVMLQGGQSCQTLKDFAIEPIDSRLNDDSRSGLQKDSDIVQVLRDHFNPPPATVGISVSGPQVLLKIITLPVMTEKDLREHLTLELDRYIPLDVLDVVWDVYPHKAPVFLQMKSGNILWL
jgi:Tfp pilus assembly PilM family ATPase